MSLIVVHMMSQLFPSGTTKQAQRAEEWPSFWSHMSFQDMVLYSPFLIYLPGRLSDLW